MTGKVYLVGAGPGDPGLLTMKGYRLIRNADVLIYDALVSLKILSYAKPDAEIIFVGKRGGQDSAEQDDIEKIIITKAREGKQIVRLKGGDPFIFGRGGEEALTLKKAHIDWEVVPGITSAIAGPAYAGIPLSHRDLTSAITILTGHENPSKGSSRIDWEKIATGAGTLVFLMGVSNLPSIISELIGHGRSKTTPCALVMWGTIPRQKTVTGTLTDIIDRAKEAGIGSPSIFVVGEVVSLRDELRWFEKGPLFGKRVLVTRSREQASQLVDSLELLGADVLQFPTIEIVPPLDWNGVDQALRKIREFQWIVFTSVNGVKCFLDRLGSNGGDIRDLTGLKIAAIGEVTRSELEKHFLKVDLSPSEFVAESLLEEMKKIQGLKGMKILLPRAEQARVILTEGLRAVGADITEVVVYRTLEGTTPLHSIILRDVLDKGLDWVTFTSSSTVKNFVSGFAQEFEKLKGNFKVASIGPITSQTAREAGLHVDVEAKIHTIPGLVEELVCYLKVQGSKV